MRRQLLDTALTQTIALPWLGFLIAGAVAWFAYRYFLQATPAPPLALERSYSQRLEQRLATGQGAAKRKRRGGPDKSHPHRH